MIRSKKVLFYGIMVVMTLLVIEGMAQVAYYIAYREFNGGGPSRTQPAVGDGARVEWWTRANVHPYYGFTRTEAGHPVNQVPPPRRQDGVVLVGLLGGSVSRDVADAFRSALAAWFRDNGIPARPVVLGLAYGGVKQPQQLMQIANTLSLGGEYDIIVNLDGYNELVLSHQGYFGGGLSPFYPWQWHLLQQYSFTDAQKLLVSRIYALRQREGRLDALAAAEPWRRSALYGIVNRYLRERTAGQILALNHELDVPTGDYTLQRYGPALTADVDEYDLSRMALRVWYRGSVLLAGLSRDAGAEYYHFLQPNQYVPDSKPLTDRELARYDTEYAAVGIYRDSYPLLLRLGDELRQQGINYYDLTQIFADNHETLYKDDCCHFNERGSELLAASMVQRLEPALRNRAALAATKVGGGGADSMTADTALDAAAQELSPVRAANELYFDVSYTAAGTLHYSRDNCRPADAAAPFFVRIAPVDAADLLPGGAVSGYNSYDFGFGRDGGTIDAAGRCVVEYELPGYDIATVWTGQYGEAGQMLWRARLTLDWGFEVERTAAGTLRYFRDNCLPVHIAADFFLHITPVDAGDLRPATVEYGFDNYDFPGFRQHDGLIDAAGGCVIERTLPEYDIASILTGQYIPAVGRRLWETRVDFE